MKILLLSGSDIDKKSKYGDFYLAGPRLQPYNLLQIASILEQHGHEVFLIDTEVEILRDNELIDKISSIRPDIAGITVYTINLDYVKRILRKVKDTFPDMLTVAGGPHIKLYPDSLVKDELADFCIAGESDLAFAELADKLEKNSDISSVPNLIFKSSEGVRINKESPFIKDLDSLPFPKFDLIRPNIRKYWPQPMTYRRRPMTILVTSRGCVYNCSFCPSSGIWGGRSWRANSPEYVGEMISMLCKDYGIREICFNENSFALNKKRVIGISEYIINKKLDIIWTANVNARSLDEEMLSYMKRSGCWLLSVGVESGSNRILKNIGKPITTEEAEKKLALIDNAGIKIRAYFMIGHMGDTAASVTDTIDFSKKLPLLTANFSIFVPVPGSRLFTDIYGHLKEHAAGDLSNYANQAAELRFKPDNMTSEEIIFYQKKAMQKFFADPARLFQLLISIRSFEDIRRYFLMFLAAWMVASAAFRKKFISHKD